MRLRRYRLCKPGCGKGLSLASRLITSNIPTKSLMSLFVTIMNEMFRVDETVTHKHVYFISQQGNRIFRRFV